MIIELFGPPGVGKTTFACTLAARLRARNRPVKLVLSYRPSEVPRTFCADHAARLGIAAALRRVVRPMVETLAAVGHSASAWEAHAIADLVRVLVPRNVISSLRLRQYVLRLARNWRAAELAAGITLFDQGFVQAVYTLALQARAADRERIGLALDAVPLPDLLVRIDAPPETVGARLVERRNRQGRIERLFDLDVATNLGSMWIFEQLYELLQTRGRRVIRVASDNRQSLFEGIAKVEAIAIGTHGGVTLAPAGERAEVYW